MQKCFKGAYKPLSNGPATIFCSISSELSDFPLDLFNLTLFFSIFLPIPPLSTLAVHFIMWYKNRIMHGLDHVEKRWEATPLYDCVAKRCFQLWHNVHLFSARFLLRSSAESLAGEYWSTFSTKNSDNLIVGKAANLSYQNLILLEAQFCYFCLQSRLIFTFFEIQERKSEKIIASKKTSWFIHKRNDVSGSRLSRALFPSDLIRESELRTKRNSLNIAKHSHLETKNSIEKKIWVILAPVLYICVFFFGMIKRFSCLEIVSVVLTSLELPSSINTNTCILNSFHSLWTFSCPVPNVPFRSFFTSIAASSVSIRPLRVVQ